MIATIIIDTNIAIRYLNGDKLILPLLDEKEIIIPFIVEIELLSWPQIDNTQQKLIEIFLSDCYLYEYNQPIKQLTIQLRKKYKLKVPDAFVAATSAYLNSPLVTADKNFKKVKEIQLINALQ